MLTRVWLALMAVMLLGGCSSSPTKSTEQDTNPASKQASEASAGASVALDNADLPRVDSAGNTPADVLTAYIRAWNRSDWKTVYSLTAPPKAAYASWARSHSEDPVPWDDFAIHETRIVEPTKALVLVTYSTIGFSSLEGLPSEEQRTVVVVRAPGEWWVLEKGPEDDAVWEVTPKGPID